MTSSDRLVVMVVEDDVEMNELQCELLSAHGMKGVPAYSGAEALELCGRCRADAVWLDLMLPEIGGIETCRRLRRTSGNDLPIVIVTALDNEDCRRRGYEAGADAYFVKPFDPDQVIEVIRMLIDRSPTEEKET